MNNYYPNYKLQRNDSTYIYPNQGEFYQNPDERFFLAPFLVGGLAGTALGYGIANNNQINNGYYMPPPVYYYPPQPYNYYNNYYY